MGAIRKCGISMLAAQRYLCHQNFWLPYPFLRSLSSVGRVLAKDDAQRWRQRSTPGEPPRSCSLLKRQLVLEPHSKLSKKLQCYQAMMQISIVYRPRGVRHDCAGRVSGCISSTLVRGFKRIYFLRLVRFFSKIAIRIRP
jgi:hypothetical protein